MGFKARSLEYPYFYKATETVQNIFLFSPNSMFDNNNNYYYLCILFIYFFGKSKQQIYFVTSAYSIGVSLVVK